MRASPLKCAGAAGALSLAAVALAADPAPQTPPSLAPAAAGTWDISWDGVPGRTYFLQFSLDLVTWTYAPVVEFGSSPSPYGADVQGADRFFVRLRYADADWVATKGEAEDADFDGDGIPNWFEVENLFSDPLDGGSAGGDSDADGLADGWELYYFGDLTSADPGAAPESDGLTNKEKSELGLDPGIDYSDPAASGPSRYTYDLAGRLTGVSAPVAAAAFTPDEEGNIQNAQ